MQLMEVTVAVLDCPLMAAICDLDDVNLKGEADSPSGEGSLPQGSLPRSSDFRTLPAPKGPKSAYPCPPASGGLLLSWVGRVTRGTRVSPSIC